MKQRLKQWYTHFKKLLGNKDKDYWDDNPYIVL